MLEEPQEAPLFCPPLWRGSGYLQLLWWPKFLCSVAIPSKNTWPGKATDHQECVQTAMCMCAMGKPQLCAPHFPMLPMSFCLAINFWHVAAYAHAIPPLPSAQKCSEDTETSGQEPQPRNGTRTCTQVLKPLLWECSRAKICLVQGGVALPPTTFWEGHRPLVQEHYYIAQKWS